MPTIVDKQKAVELLEREFAALGALASSLDPAQWELASCLPGWTVRDVLAHVVGTESMLLGEQAPPADLSGLDYLRNPIAEANELWVQSMRSLPIADFLARYDEVTGRRLEALTAMTQADFDAPSWTPAGPDETYGRFMRIRHFDCFMHEHDIRASIGSGPRLDPEAIRSCLDEVETGLGFIVGKRAGFPEGSGVRIDLSGPVPATFLVAVHGRAGVVPGLEGPPTVGLEMPAELFLRLAGGRADGATRLDEVRTSGDPELAERLVANLAFTI